MMHQPFTKAKARFACLRAGFWFVYLAIPTTLWFLLCLATPASAGVITPLPPNRQVTDAGLTKLADATNPALARLGSQLYATWLDERTGFDHPDVYFAHSTDGGQSWSTNVAVSVRPYDDWPDNPVIAVQPDGTLWIAWYLFYTDNFDVANDVRLARSTDNGQTWTRTTLVNGVADNEDLWRPALTVDDQFVYLLYHLRGEVGGVTGYDIKLKVMNTQTLTALTTNVSDAAVAGRITDGLLDDGPAMTLVERNGVLCAAWEDRRSTFAIYSACSTDQGVTFSPNHALSAANAVYPVLALAPDGTLYGSYTLAGDARRNISLRASSDRGATWGAPRPVTQVDSPLAVGDWDLAVDGAGQLAVGWISVGVNVHHVLLSTSTDGGQNFSRLPVQDAQGQFPTVSDPVNVKLVNSGEGSTTNVHLLWADNRNVHDEIWSTTALLDGLPPAAPGTVQAQADESSIMLTWQPATDANGLSGYRVYRATAATGPFTELTTFLNLVTTYRDVELPPGTPYFYTVAAVDTTGNLGPQSAVASAAAVASSGLPVYGQIVYQSGSDIKVRNLADNSESTVANAAQPHVTLANQQLYFTSNRTILARPIQGGPNMTFAGPFESGLEFDVAADNTAFAVITLRQFGAPGVPGGLCTVAEPHYFVRAGQESYVGTNALATDLALAANGTWLAYRYTGFCNVAGINMVSPASLCLVKTATGARSCTEGSDAHDPHFAPDANWLVFAAPFTGQSEIWKASIGDDGALTQYTQLTRGPVNQPSRGPAYATDGNWIVFARDVDPGSVENFRLFVVRNDGQGLRPLEIVGSAPAWLGGGSAAPLPDLPFKLNLPLIRRP